MCVGGYGGQSEICNALLKQVVYSCNVWFKLNLFHIIIDTLTTQQLGRVTINNTFTARILQKWHHKHQFDRQQGEHKGTCNKVVMERSGQRTGHRQRSQYSGDHSRRTAAIRFYFLSRSGQFSAHPKSSRSRIDKRTARATGNTYAIATVKSPLWTTKWLTTVFPWPAQIQFPLQ